MNTIIFIVVAFVIVLAYFCCFDKYYDIEINKRSNIKTMKQEIRKYYEEKEKKQKIMDIEKKKLLEKIKIFDLEPSKIKHHITYNYHGKILFIKNNVSASFDIYKEANTYVLLFTEDEELIKIFNNIELKALYSCVNDEVEKHIKELKEKEEEKIQQIKNKYL